MYKNFINEFESKLKPKLEPAQMALEKQLRKLMQDSGLLIQSLSSRIKGVESLRQKLARPDRSYKSLSEVTDLLAFRVITYSEDMIPVVARIIEQTFDVDYTNSTNKLFNEDAQKFGYRSLHYVCQIPQSLSSLAEVKDFKFEIQIRTILQHTWAEIEHDIGYKSSEQLPRELRRRFSQVASLLEIADREFAAIRMDLKSYQTALANAKLSQTDLEVDHISLQSVLLVRPEVQSLDAEVAKYLSVSTESEAFYPDYLVSALRAAGLQHLNQILQRSQDLLPRLAQFLPIYFEFADKHWDFKSASIPKVKAGYGLLFLAHLHILDSDDLYINKAEHLSRFYQQIDRPKDAKAAKSAAKALMTALKLQKFIHE